MEEISPAVNGLSEDTLKRWGSKNIIPSGANRDAWLAFIYEQCQQEAISQKWHDAFEDSWSHWREIRCSIKKGNTDVINNTERLSVSSSTISEKNNKKSEESDENSRASTGFSEPSLAYIFFNSLSKSNLISLCFFTLITLVGALILIMYFYNVSTGDDPRSIIENDFELPKNEIFINYNKGVVKIEKAE